MLLPESDDELEDFLSGSEIQSSSDGESGTDLEDTSYEDSSEEEWNSSATKRGAVGKHRCSDSVSPLSMSLRSPSKRKEERCMRCPGPPSKRISNASMPPKVSSSLQAVGVFSSGEKQAEKELARNEPDADRWHDVDEEDFEPPQPRFRPERVPGPQLNRTANYTPLELFQLFFSTTVIDNLVKHTNANGKKKRQAQQKHWHTVTREDMYSFLSLVLYMGMVPLKAMTDFWKGSKLYRLPFPSSVMPSNRFLAISRSLHINDPAVETANDLKKGTPGYDKLCRIKPLYEQILAACYTFFHPYQHISVDERMVATKARIGLKRYVRNKPTKWGIKLYVLADSSCGYTLNFFVDAGKDPEPTGKGRSYDIVMRILNVPFLGKGYKLYMDNFYTSPALFRDLLSRKIWACGTLRPNMAGYPKKKGNDMTDKTPRGTIRWIRQGELLFVKWFDARQVNMCSTMHKAYSNDTAMRKVKNAKGEWTVKRVPIPGCIKDYNQHMGGVDLSDALISYYNVLHKTLKWYKTLFYHFVDIATVNAFILHKEMCKLQDRPELKQKAFREQLILSLAGIGSTPRRSAPQNHPGLAVAAPAAPSSSQVPDTTPPTAPASSHLPAYFVEHMNDVTPRFRATLGRRTCVLCKRKSPVYCSTCKKTLCFTSLRNCYRDWHRSNSICT
ncbi:piggyBac transposable element-derived protein 4-like [Takifugu flavidus]|uniref:PiggyBac transposable element-derived protein domain-containing protein n=1 Tax=Takifugu flavidus TaxID=433684 RepID=A0A5C6NM60_9TELE|nr:piggyBac transposable element-derived protein 4-like [Takifugu flavidus]TWW67701.1 hypothetical protein D4764_02G0007420 [Takifugu flavidus]